MEFRLLGPIEVAGDHDPIDLGPPQQRAVLAALLIDADRLVTVEALIGRVWDEAPPAAARQGLYAYVSRLRAVLAAAAPGTAGLTVSRRTGGYLLDVDPDRVDVHRFHRLIAMGQEIRRPETEQMRLLREALDLWRGTPLADVPGAWAVRVREALFQKRVDAAVRWADLQLRSDRPSGVVSFARQMLAEHPLAEPLAAAMMRALLAEDRRAEALACYAAVRARLSEELGCEPGPQLQELHLAVLREDQLTVSPAVQPAPPDPTRPLPAQLPMAVRGFVGRDEQLAWLHELLAGGSAHRQMLIISAVSGTAGVGKTALAVHWAHRVKHLFPDGQLYVNLRGFGPDGAAVDPLHVVRAFLDALGIAPQHVPADPDAQIALYRSAVADKQILLLLDNARDAAQVRPLLPGTPACLVLVTSRNRLDSLIAAEGAHSMTLDLLSAADARDLLAHRIGAQRVDAEPDAVDEIVARCARLPLALTIVAARASQPQIPLGTLASDLADARRGLDTLAGGDAITDVRAVFSWSYRQLTARSARLFRLLGVHPGPDFSTAAVASLAAVPVGQVQAQVDELISAHLLTEHTPGRYGFHDLLQVYAREQAEHIEAEEDIEAAATRILDHYVYAAHSAAMTLEPGRADTPISVSDQCPAVTVEKSPDAQAALAWFGAEHAVLLAAIDLAAARGLHVHTFQLAWCLADYFSRHGLWHDWLRTQQTALAAARQIPHRGAQANAHRNIALANARLRRYDEAETHLRDALGIYERCDDNLGRAHTHNSLAWMYSLQGRYVEAIAENRQSMTGFQSIGDWRGQADTLNNLGWHYAQVRDFRQALTLCGQALEIHQRIGYLLGEAATWDSLGYIRHQLNEHRSALAHYGNALALYERIGHRYQQSVVLHHIGDTQHEMGDLAAARDAWRRAKDILREMGHPGVAILQERLDRSQPAALATGTDGPRDEAVRTARTSIRSRGKDVQPRVQAGAVTASRYRVPSV